MRRKTLRTHRAASRPGPVVERNTQNICIPVFKGYKNGCHRLLGRRLSQGPRQRHQVGLRPANPGLRHAHAP